MPERRVKYYTLRNIDRLAQIKRLSSNQRFALEVVGRVLPFRVNSYVTDELIDWSRVPDDPIFQLTFLQRGMLRERQFARVADAIRARRPDSEVEEIAREIRLELNPHPAGQLTANVPVVNGTRIPGVQHKYRETCLLFPAAGQTCHAYCTFCFRWPQFVGMNGFRLAVRQSQAFQSYLKDQPEVTDVLVTGGDPMVMSAGKLAAYIEPLLGPEFDHIQTVRIGTKSISYNPFRYLTDRDSDQVLRLFEKIIARGKHLAVMAHVNHWRELSTQPAREAVRRIRSTGAHIRSQSPLVRHVNDDAEVWARTWQEQVALGISPYYMFVERDTGASEHFAVPLVDAWQIFRKAQRRVSGLARTARGPVMSAFPGKVVVDGVAHVRGERVFVLSFIQARQPENVRRPFFARFDPKATWLTDLVPAFGADRFFYQDAPRSFPYPKVRQDQGATDFGRPEA